MQGTPPALRQKAARLVGGKCTLLARVDAYGEDPSGVQGAAMKVRGCCLCRCCPCARSCYPHADSLHARIALLRKAVPPGDGVTAKGCCSGCMRKPLRPGVVPL